MFPPALGWTHYLILMRVTNPAARAFYEIEAAREAWSTRQLERQIGALLFDHLAKHRDPEISSRPYAGAPIARMLRGGPTMASVFGHRDNTYERGRGDPGDEIFRRLAAAGAERLDFDTGEDLAIWRARQARLLELGERITIDGEPGPATIGAMRRRGLANGSELDAS